MSGGPHRRLLSAKIGDIVCWHFDDHSVIIKNVNGIYTVEADWLLQVMKGINFDDYESLNYFQKVLINGGVIDALRKKGCSDGDTVSIYELEFDFMD